MKKPGRVGRKRIWIALSQGDAALFDSFNAEKIRALINATLHHLMVGDLTWAQIMQFTRLDEGVHRKTILELDIPMMRTIAAMNEDVEMDSFVRFALRYSQILQKRWDLEEEYKKTGGVGDPAFFSDDFLFLWAKHNSANNGDAARVIRSLLSLENRYAVQEKRVRDLENLFSKYAIPGILKATETPRRLELLHMGRDELMTVATRWDVKVATISRTSEIRRQVMAALGYAAFTEADIEGTT